MNSKVVGVAAGLGLAALIGYCIYFDRKRRSASDFKSKLKEKRERKSKKRVTDVPVLPNMNDPEAVQVFFLQQIELGEKFMASGDFEAGAKHFSYAILVIGNPGPILGIFEQTMPSEAYDLLIKMIPETKKKMSQEIVGKFPGLEAPLSTAALNGMSVDDVE